MTNRIALYASAAMIALQPMALPAVALFSVVSCSPDSARQYEMARSYLDAAVAATLAAGQQALDSPTLSAKAKAVIEHAMLELQRTKSIADSTVAPSDWRSAADQVMNVLTQLTQDPTVNSLLGGAAPYVPLAIAVVTAFVQSYQPPANAPSTPPVALLRKGAEFHGNGKGVLRHAAQP